MLTEKELNVVWGLGVQLMDRPEGYSRYWEEEDAKAVFKQATFAASLVEFIEGLGAPYNVPGLPATLVAINTFIKENQ